MRLMNAAIAAILTASSFGCSVPSGTTAQRNAALEACGLQNDPSITDDVDLRACDPSQTKKTTICHIPPGNPANAHTLCVGNAAVRAHVDNHQDTLGACPNEVPCEPPGVDAGAGSGSDAGDIDGGGVIL